MYSEEVPFTPAPERTSKRNRERGKRKQNNLLDVLAQFPDIPFIPTCTPGRISPGTRIPEVISTNYAYRMHPTAFSSESDASTLSYTSGPLSDNLEQTSSSGTPDLGARSYSPTPVSTGKCGVYGGTEDASVRMAPHLYVPEQFAYLFEGNSFTFSNPLATTSTSFLFVYIDTPTFKGDVPLESSDTKGMMKNISVKRPFECQASKLDGY